MLAQECAERRAVVRRLEACFGAGGYSLVETPVLETSRVLEAGAGSSLEGRALFVQDTDGSLLAMRPEMTVPLARLVATRLAGHPDPKRLAYVADVFREQASLRGQARQFTQAGVELVGASGPAADAEVIGMLVAALEAAGLDDFKVAVGTVAVLRALLEATGADEAWRRGVLAAAHRRDLVEYARLIDGAGLGGDLARALREVPLVRGATEALSRCRALVTPCGCGAAIDSLEEAVFIMDEAGRSERLIVDFGVMRDFDYYTGLIVEAYAPGLGVPLGGGGRYDGVLGVFGAPAPAAGFALGVDRLHIALADQGRLPRVRGLDAVVGGPRPGEVFSACGLLRRAGWQVVPAAGSSRTDLVRIAVEASTSTALWAEGASLGVLAPDGSVESALDPGAVPAPPTLETTR